MPDPDRLDPADYPDRDSLIGDLVVRLGWTAAKVGGCFGISARQVRRIAAEGPGIPAFRLPALTLEEARRMMNDYLRDPYIRPDEIEAAREWIASQGAA